MKMLRKVALPLAAAAALLFFGAPAAGAAAPAPAWSIQSLASPTNFPLVEPSEATKQPTYRVIFSNSGGEETDGTPIQIVDTLPEGLVVKETRLTAAHGAPIPCTTTTHVFGGTATDTVSCEVTNAPIPQELEPARLVPDAALRLDIKVAAPASAGPLVNRVEVKGGGAEAATAEAENRASEEPAKAGLEEFHAELSGVDGKAIHGAASHPFEYTTSFAVNTVPTPPGSFSAFLPAEGDIRQIEVELPPGLVGNLSSVSRCTAQQFTTFHPHGSGGASINSCPVSSQVGMINVETLEGTGYFGLVSVYNLVPPPGMPAQFGYQVYGYPNYIDTKVRSESDYGITAYLPNITQARRVTTARTSFWGVPWAASHDAQRGECGPGERCPVEGEGPTRPFLRLPTSCANPLTTTMNFSTWAQPATEAEKGSTEPAATECEKPPFDPTIEAKPTTNVADAPSGLHVDVHIPQEENEDPEGLSEADLKDATVTLPEGLAINPSSADGLDACSLSQIGYRGEYEGHPRFSGEAPHCPDAAKVGSVEIDAPAVDHPLPGAVYLAKQNENPFNSLLAIYITVNDPQSGIVVKLAGHVQADPQTGQLTTTVDQSPQLPFEDFKLDFFQGARAPLRTPSACGTYTTTAAFTPWSAPAGSSSFPTDSFQTTTPPAGQSSCATSAASLPSAPSFEAGTESPLAGAFSPLLVNLARADGTQEFGRLTLSPPPGLLAKLAGIPYCSEAALAAAAKKSGRSELSSPSCPAASQVGTATVATGAGPAPYSVTGKVYLAGPYEGAPLSLAVITPAVAGPFDLGTVVVRTALHVDPATAQITATTDPIPHILEGIPLDVRSIAVKLDHPGWGLNPTNCEPFAFAGSLQSVLGSSAALSNRFQVGGCSNLGFKPSLSLKLRGGTKRGGHPALHATLNYPNSQGYANIAFAQVALPHSEFLDQAHIGTVCTRVQFAAHQCPAKSVYGYAKATTPLLEAPLEGPVYLRSSSNQLPDLVVDLNGQVEVALDGRNDSIHGGLRNTFEAVPDAPVSKFELNLFGAKKGLLENSTDICQGTHKATVRYVAQNGKTLTVRPALEPQCKGAKGRKGHKGHHRRKG